jgi:hypothetical protein
MQVELGRHGGIDRFEKGAELRRAVPAVAAADDHRAFGPIPRRDVGAADRTHGHIQGGEQRGGAMPDVVRAAPLRLPVESGAFDHRQPGCVRSIACISVFSSTHSTSARSGGLR